MSQAEFLPFLGIVDYLRQLCAQGRSGTLFLVSDDNRMAQVRLDNGQIASLLCRNQRGLQALGIVRGMQRARLRFDESLLAKGENDNLSTQAVFDNLAAAVGGAPAAPSAPAAHAPGLAAVVSNAAPMTLTPQFKATVQRIMTEYIGPMAEIICDDHFEAAGNLQALMQLLAGEISSPERAAKFRADMARELGM
jgi:hypothetical protein